MNNPITQNIKLGNGKTVHLLSQNLKGEDFPPFIMCGQRQTFGSGLMKGYTDKPQQQVIVDSPVTCVKCLKWLAKFEN